MSKNVLFSIVILLVFLLISIANLDLKTESFKTAIEITVTIGSAVLGGYVAFYSAYIQVEGNRKMENYKEHKLIKNICLLVSNDLMDINKRLTVIIKEKEELDYSELAPYIDTNALLKFKTDFIHVFENENHINVFSKVLNRLMIINNSGNKIVKTNKLISLTTDIEQLIEVIEIYKNKIDKEKEKTML